VKINLEQVIKDVCILSEVTPESLADSMGISISEFMRLYTDSSTSAPVVKIYE
jgi:ribosomal protein S25